jgi:lipopolysaccharide/colanic/teichoic acid biosynthesis glycosyltransferase
VGAEAGKGAASTGHMDVRADTDTTASTSTSEDARDLVSIDDTREGLSPGVPIEDAKTKSGATVIDLRSGDPVIHTQSPVSIVSRAHTPYVRFAKPLIDRILGTVALVVVTPLLLLVALGIRLTLGKGVLFRQPRVGKDGVVFDVIKFRTMGEDRRSEQALYVGPERRQNHKSEDDPRHTAFGRFLRKWSLDEFPQFLNVVRGDMSLVGPRPEMVSIVEKYEPWQHARHQVRPGITGIWQVSERNGTPLHEATHLDIEYVETVSLLTDLGIMLKTVPAMLGRSTGK